MEYSLQAIYYLIRGTINLMLQVEVTEGVTVGGVLFAVMLLSGLFGMLGLINWHSNSIGPAGPDPDQLTLPDYGGHGPGTRGDNFTMR